MQAQFETISEFYQRKFNWIPDSLRPGVGQFNVFRLDPELAKPGKTAIYRQRDYYKVLLVIGPCRIHFGITSFNIQKQALVFIPPLLMYRWEQAGPVPHGYFFVFNSEFFRQFGQIQQYPVFQPGGNHVIEIPDNKLDQGIGFYERMLEEIDSEYIYKYDALRNIVFDMLHFAMKTQPSTQLTQQPINASQRIATLFTELLERQFPIDNPGQVVQLRSASDFAGRLYIHVNHLNRAIRQATHRTSTQLIAERILEEAKILLKQSTWTISEIAYALGFVEVTYFNSFFKKHTQRSPGEFRNV